MSFTFLAQIADILGGDSPTRAGATMSPGNHVVQGYRSIEEDYVKAALA